MLDPTEAGEVAAAFGVATEQVRRDHLISHLLAALTRIPGSTERIVFFGGTALARTHLPKARLSEDIDLLAVGDRDEIADDIERALTRSVRREFGAIRWVPSLREVPSVKSAVAETVEGQRVRVQLLLARDYPAWPTEIADIAQRYSDVAATRLRVLTLPAFVAAKTVAWGDRHAPRDLFDLHALAQRGAFTPAAARLYRELGPTGHPPAPYVFDQPPTEAKWRTDLGAQTRLSTTAAEAAAVVGEAWAALSAGIVTPRRIGS